MLCAPSTFFIQLEDYGGGCCIFCCCLGIFMSSSFNYLVLVDLFIYLMSLLWSWIVVGRLIFCTSLKLLSKPRCLVLIPIIAVVMQLYFIHLTFFHYAFIYIYFLISDYVLFRLILFPLKYLSICCSKFYGKLWSYLGYEFFMEVLKIGLQC